MDQIKIEDLNFEQALNRLEKVVEAMENEETPLEESITLYKEGVGLSKRCNEILGKLEGEITLLQQDLSEKPLSEGEDYV